MKYSRLIRCTDNHVLDQILQRKAIVCELCIARTLYCHVLGGKTAITAQPLSCHAKETQWHAMMMLITISIYGKPDYHRPKYKRRFFKACLTRTFQEEEIRYIQLTITSNRIYKKSLASQLRGGADKSIARPGRKQATTTKLGTYSAYSPRSTIHFSARCSNVADH